MLSFLIFWPIFLGKVNLNGNLLVSFYAPWGENLPFKNSGWDGLRIYFPFYKVTLDSIKGGQFPLWNPFAFAGHPHAADFQSAVFYPLNIFGLLMSQVVFWHFLRLTPTILASFFTFLYLRNLRFDNERHPELDSGSIKMPKRVRHDRRVGLSKLASLFGAITFGFSPFILTWGEEVVMSPHSIIWLPLVLLGIDRFKESGKAKFLGVISFSLAVSFLGGYMQTTIYLCLFAGLYFLLRFGRNVFSRRGLMIIGAFVFGALIAAIQLLPSAELYFRSARAQIALTDQLYGFLLPKETLVTYLVPDFFGHPATGNFFRPGAAQYYEGIMFAGVAALIFAVYAIFNNWKNRFVLLLTGIGIISILTTLDWPGARMFLKLPIPFLSTSIPNRILFVPAFCISILASYGFDLWQRTKGKKILGAVFLVGFLYLVLIGALLYFKTYKIAYFDPKKFHLDFALAVSFRNLVVPILVYAVCAFLIFLGQKRVSKRAVGFLIIIISFAHVFYFSQKYFSFSDEKYIFPQTPELNFIRENQGIWRTWGVGKATIQSNFASQLGIYAGDGYDSLNNKRYGEFTYAMQGGKLTDFIFRADAGAGLGNARELLANPNRRKLIDLLGTRLVITASDESKTMESFNFKKAFGGGIFSVFENQQVVPRVFLASNYEKITGDGQIITRLLADDFNMRQSLVLEKGSPISPQAGPGSVEVLSYKSQEVIVKTKSDAPKLLFISDNFYPGWKAKVDGDETEIMRADYTFRAVPLTAGEHIVRFYFDSDSFKLGAVISLVSLGVLLAFTLGRIRLLD
ncbi:MAG: YfhO family protein [Candidatus Curtissbacteria bacterium]|nr:YfhO family protein [Candidatus Curtissbacteria bacterium]